MTAAVCFFTDSSTVGGAEEAMLGLIAGLDRTRWQPRLLHADHPGVDILAERAAELDVPVHAVPAMPLGARGAARLLPFARGLRRARPDLFHAHLSWPLAAKYALAGALAARVPAVVATVHLFPDFEPGAVARVQQRLLGRGVDRYIAVSDDVATRLRRAFGWTPPRVEVIRNGIELEGFPARRDEEVRRSLTGGVEAPVALFVGRLHEQKGAADLLAAAALVPGVRVALAGDGPLRGQLEHRADELGLRGRVTFLGARDDVPALLAAADLFVLPSRYEGTSLALLEAMAAGVPIVATGIGGTRELVGDETTALLVPPGDAPGLAAAIARLAGDRALGARLGEAARQRARRCFSRAAATARTAAVYEDVLDRA